jgi:HNH endonuclease
MTIPLKDRAAFIAAADPDWLDTLNASGFDRLVYYKNPYNAPGLPIGSWFLCYRRGEHPPRLHLAGMVAAVDELSLDEAWSRYGLRLGVGHTAQSHPQWIAVARSVLRDHVRSVYCIELQNPRWYQPPILLSAMGIAVSGGTGQMGKALSHGEIDRCEDLLLSAPPLLPKQPEHVQRDGELEQVRSQQEEAGAFAPADLEDARKRILTAIVLRQGQRTFRDQLLAAYRQICAVTGCDVVEALEAAHIVAYRGPETNHVTNGLLLRADIHILFDLGLLAVHPQDYRLMVSRRLKGTAYASLDGQMLRLPINHAEHPSREALECHMAVFRSKESESGPA